ncbi:alpha-N-acetylgalactosaminide alpha-2,6-sialyltransferase 1 [Rhinatrema bivittatum]|uniref:alpha-N-acetylgalactosaminide alpha-2,6-sialyltransferase 1 n=1 Tax=Rhinatrema bivittatum TaxID=194408 RepID=UPI00112D13CC|nr:alpha-N-acetylgalactosaminide alpha-2,6-sialyltransferase 1 [Rhinatrema bivittatum]
MVQLARKSETPEEEEEMEMDVQAEETADSSMDMEQTKGLLPTLNTLERVEPASDLTNLRDLSPPKNQKAYSRNRGKENHILPKVSEVNTKIGGPTTPQKKRLKKKDFEREPKWDFEDKYTMEASAIQTNCPYSVKIKAASSPYLRNQYLHNITLFMDRRIFSEKEWERLEHFVPPYGWMELNRSDVQEAVSFLPPIPQQQILLSANSSQHPKCVSCAVVGNGGILNNSRMGKEIDSHDYIFRVNGAVVKGFEADVGTRTSFYGFTVHTMLASLSLLKGSGFPTVPEGKDVKYILFTEQARDYDWLIALILNKKVKKGLSFYRIRPRDHFTDKFKLQNILVVHPDFPRYLKNRFFQSKKLNTTIWHLYRPTTGALLLMTALHLCDMVSAYGFMTDSYKEYSDHYYDKVMKPLIFILDHDFPLELNLWKKLHEEKILKLYQRPKPETPSPMPPKLAKREKDKSKGPDPKMAPAAVEKGTEGTVMVTASPALTVTEIKDAVLAALDCKLTGILDQIGAL